jgi:serine/threonine protein kinase
MVMELIKGKELFDKIAEIEHYNENIARKIFKELILSIEYLHKKKICHRDIKPSNIMILDSDNTKIKLIDLNVAKKS